MGILSWIVLGLVAGLIAKLLMPGRDPGGCILTVVLGITGALLGGWLGGTLFNIHLGTFYDPRTWGLAIVGSMIILAAYRLLIGSPSRRV
ncbi:GlsB/YeaQ/YmgE family stress response membrane protein [Haloechinothrix sp. LS1_15]|uniref:GlsB/YeaQ/YmgE family stress response membrane protein n=1 Tax=Haloechinothrix sp. LS1_15 TaxID=2652248 RepID=UPI002945DCD3|nr:GlsB/YeaQ/YmgE family stress response membrane protein [Haloechinothrix sp. LS1_15]MDV6011753.1 GlsB/YeaQ/YmgE family stress response membrane protein [Haloechinothrix sp. LS1_15]